MSMTGPGIARRSIGVVAAMFMLALTHIAPAAPALPEDKPTLKLHKSDRIAFIGGTFSERLQLFSHFEAMLTSAKPEMDLSFRYLAWSGDTLTQQMRPLNFGSMHEHLTRVKPTVIFACYGMAESFDGAAGLKQFEKDWNDALTVLAGTAFNGVAPPRVVLVSPIFHENLGGYMPDATKHNDQLRAYTEVMRRVAAARKLPLIDLFEATSKYSRDNASMPLTYNGIHLTPYGDWVVGQMMLEAMGIEPQSWRMEIDTGASGSRGPVNFKVSGALPISAPPTKSAPAALLAHQPRVTIKRLEAGTYELRSNGKAVASAGNAAWAKGVRLSGGVGHDRVEALRQIIVEKNQLFFYRYRPVNGEYVFGRRAKPFGVENFPPEMQKLEEMVAAMERRIWQTAQPLDAQEFQLVRVGD